MARSSMHVCGGIASFFIIFIVCAQHMHHSAAQIAEWFTFAVVGSLFPDIDIKSKGQQLIYTLLLITIPILILYGCIGHALIITIVSLTPLMTKHRGLFHEFWFIMLLVLITTVYAAHCFPNASRRITLDALFFVAGLISHLLLDGYGIRVLRKY